MYYFPGPFKKNERIDTTGVKLGHTLASGKQALRVALESFRLPAQSAVAIPAFCCNEVVGAVLDAKLKPVFFDVKKTGSYWAAYDETKLKTEQVKALVITHLYGYLHPDTAAIAAFCKNNGIALVHDAAQSYGIDESQLMDAPLVYSFGPGKSTTAARGGELLNIPAERLGKWKAAGFWENLDAKLFFENRLYGSKPGMLHSIKVRMVQRFRVFTGLTGISPFQKEKALQAKAIARTKGKERYERYLLMKKGVEYTTALRIADAADPGLAFKMVIWVEKDVERFLKYLEDHRIPYCRLADSMELEKRDLSSCKHFSETYKGLVEISTERSIPTDEVERVAQLISNYK